MTTYGIFCLNMRDEISYKELLLKLYVIVSSSRVYAPFSLGLHGCS